LCKAPLRSLLLGLCFLLLLPYTHALALYPPERELSPLPRNITYVAVGDSITAGWGASVVEGARQNGYVAQLHRQLLVRGNSRVHNLGVPGLTSGQFLFVMEHWPEMSRLLSQAGLITLSIGGNDIIWTDHQSPGDVDKMREALSKYEVNIVTILHRIRKLNPEARLFVLEVYNPFPLQDERHQALQAWITSVNESIAAAATVYHAEVVPTASLFLGKENQFVNLANNDIHPNTAGHTRIAESITGRLLGRFVPLIVQEKMKPNLLLNGERKQLPGDLLIENDTVYVSVDQLPELFGSAPPAVRYRIGDWSIRVNGKRIRLSSPVLLKDGRPYLPLRPPSETLGRQVYWVGSSRTINIVTPAAPASH